MVKLQDEIKQTKPFVNIETEVYLNLVRLTHDLADRVTRLLKTADLSMPQYNALRILRGAGPQGLACNEIATRMIHRVPDMTRLLDRLEAKGLITRERQPDDRRVVRTAIQPAGLDLIAPLDEPIATLHQDTLGRLGQERLTHLLTLIEDARDFLPDVEE